MYGSFFIQYVKATNWTIFFFPSQSKTAKIITADIKVKYKCTAHLQTTTRQIIERHLQVLHNKVNGLHCSSYKYSVFRHSMHSCSSSSVLLGSITASAHCSTMQFFFIWWPLVLNQSSLLNRSS